MLDELAEVADEWLQMPEGERISWSLDWDQVMGSHLPELQRHYSRRELTPEQRLGYRQLRCRLKEALPTIQRLELYPPPVLLEDRPRKRSRA
jgi:hypothetical protein